jgi:hypothetical protein
MFVYLYILFIMEDYADGGDVIFIVSGLPLSVETDVLSATIFFRDT